MKHKNQKKKRHMKTWHLVLCHHPQLSVSSSPPTSIPLTSFIPCGLFAPLKACPPARSLRTERGGGVGNVDSTHTGGSADAPRIGGVGVAGFFKLLLGLGCGLLTGLGGGARFVLVWSEWLRCMVAGDVPPAGTSAGWSLPRSFPGFKSSSPSMVS